MCQCALKVRDGSYSVSVAACAEHQHSEFRVRAWIVAKGFLFSSTKDDTGPAAEDALPTERCPFFPQKKVCSLESYVAEHAKEPIVQLGVSLFVDGEARPMKHYFQFENPRPGSEAEMKLRLGQAIQESLRELGVQASETIVGSLIDALHLWLPCFRLPVVGAGSSPSFIHAVQEELKKLPVPTQSDGHLCQECGSKCAVGQTQCASCGAMVEEIRNVSQPKNKRPQSVLEDEQTAKRVHVEGGSVSSVNDTKHDDLDETMFSSGTGSFSVGSSTYPPSNGWPRTGVTPKSAYNQREDTANRGKATNPFDDDDGEEVKVTRHVLNLDPPESPAKRVEKNINMDDSKDWALSGIGDVLNDSKYGEFLAQVKSLATDFTAQYKLPRIAVIGSESAGKSSVLERIAMQPVFPRDRNLCTRCPIKLSLRHDPTADELEPVTIRFGRRTMTVLQANVGDTVKALMNESVCEINGGLHGIVGEELVIEMRKPNVPTIDLIDLPGIVAASLPDEPGDMMKQTRDLVERYVKDPNTLVVAVVPATIKRVRDAQAMQIVQTHDAQNRTIGVLTMVDLVHDSWGPDPRWELRERLNGVSDDLVKLSAGYIAVKSRDMRENLTIAEAAVQELEWFKNNLQEFDRLERVSSVALIRQLDRFYTEHIRAKWVPEALRGLSVHASSIRDEAAVLGPDPQELGVEGLLNATAALAGLMEKTLARMLSDHLKPNFSACFGQPDVTQNYPTVTRARQNAHSKKVCATFLNDQWFPDTCVKVAKQVVTSAFAQSTFNVRLIRFEKLRNVIESVASDCVLENMAQFRQSCLKRIKFSLPTVVEFLELVIEYLFLPFFDVLSQSIPEFQRYLVGRGVDLAELLVEAQEAQRRELNTAHQNVLRACQLLKAL